MTKSNTRDTPKHDDPSGKEASAGKSRSRAGRSSKRTTASDRAPPPDSSTYPNSLTGHFLIAMPGMGDPNFEHGITFICQHGEDGAMGLMVNRLSNFSLGDILRQMNMPCELPDIAATPVLAGGPVQPERGFVLHAAGDHDWESSYRVSDGLVVTTSRDVLAAMAKGQGPTRTLVTLGYAGWGAGQLEQELRENAWLTVHADNRILFDTALDERWGAAVALVGINPANLTSYSGRA